MSKQRVVLYSSNLTATGDYIEAVDPNDEYHYVDSEGNVIPKGFNSKTITKDGVHGLLIAAISEFNLYGFVRSVINAGHLEALALTGETKTIYIDDEPVEVPALNTIFEYQTLYTPEDQAKVDLCWDSTYIDSEGQEKSKGLRPRDLDL